MTEQKLLKLRQLVMASLSATLVSTIFTTNEAKAVSAPIECTAVGTTSIRDVSTLRINVQVGDFIQINAPLEPWDSAGSVGLSINGSLSKSIHVPNSLAVSSDGTVTISQEAGGASITCNRTGSAGILLYVRTQAQAIQQALLMNALARRGNGGNVVSQNSLFIASRNLVDGTSYQDTPEFNAWFSLEGRKLDGDTDGSTADLTFGFDQEIGENSFIGGFVGYSHQKLTTSGTSSTSKSPAIGTYGSFALGQDLFLDAHIGYSRPSYDIGAASFDADRYFGGLSLNGRIHRENVEYAPFFTLQSVREDRPSYLDGATTVAANTIQSHVGSLGLRIDANRAWSNGLKPYASVAVDFTKSSDDTGAEDEFVSPRIGFGGSFETGSGLLRFDFDLGKVGSNTRDYGANISYELNF